MRAWVQMVAMAIVHPNLSPRVGTFCANLSSPLRTCKARCHKERREGKRGKRGGGVRGEDKRGGEEG